MLESVNILEWLKLLVGITLFLGPGFCAITILYQDALKSLTHLLALSIALSVCSWGIFLAWLKLFNLRINSLGVFVFFLSGWVVGLIYLKVSRCSINSQLFSIKRSDLVIWILAAVTGMIVLWSLRHQVAGLGSDSYHHTLIAQLIHDNGGLPSNYQPATDQLISFSYHYGYHASMAALMWLSGWNSRLLVLASGALLLMFSTVTSALLAEELTDQSLAGIVAGAFTGLVCVFPMYFLNWGRYPQLAGLAIFAVFLQMLVSHFKKSNRYIDFQKIILLAIAAAGIAITHYRVTIMAAFAVIFLLLFIKKNNRFSFKENIRLLFSLLITAGLAFLFFFPWLLQIFESHQIGYSIRYASLDASFYSLQRLGLDVRNYPTNIIVYLFLVSGLVWGCVKRMWVIFWTTVWGSTLFLFSGPSLISISMDTISVVTSLYLPAAVVIAWFVQETLTKKRMLYKQVFFILLLLCLIWSGNVALNKNLTGMGFVTLDDLEASEWIKVNTPQNAYFMVNTFKFGFSSNFVIGIDAGYWLPLLADRRTVTIPMIFDLEMFREPDGLQHLLDLHELGANLTTPAAIERLRKEKISYVYIGEQGGPIDVDLLKGSKNFSLAYQKSQVYVFEVIY